jgi:hypothetical protein
MAKKSKTSVKEESKASDEEEYRVSSKEPARIDFFYILTGGGVLIGVILVIFIIFRYIFHVL